MDYSILSEKVLSTGLTEKEDRNKEKGRKFIASLMRNPKPIDAEKGWYFHGTYGMSIEHFEI